MVDGADAAVQGMLASWCVPDLRTGGLRTKALYYAAILRALHGKVEYQDAARAYETLNAKEAAPMQARPYQVAALEAWEKAKRRAVVVLPTGTGKSYVALRAILSAQRSTLVLAPTIDLVEQWAGDLSKRLGCDIGRYGGGEKDLKPITVSTYDSGILIAPWHGNRFGLLIFDECHHLPALATAQVAECCLAPFRLGLTATPERADGGHDRLTELIGPIAHRSNIREMEGRFLANYEAQVLSVRLDDDEWDTYQSERRLYLDFVRANGIDFSQPDAWTSFIQLAARDPIGRRAMQAWREQRRISRSGRAKLRALWSVLRQHVSERTIVFTDDNATAYHLGRRLCLPVLTHRTKPTERRAMLDNFRTGRWPILVTSRVLNEGIDVPEASVGVVVSGTGSVREHVQRLGRILRPSAGKTAVLYEIVSEGTGEGSTSERRRAHQAFGGEEEGMLFAEASGEGTTEEEC